MELVGAAYRPDGWFGGIRGWSSAPCYTRAGATRCSSASTRH